MNKEGNLKRSSRNMKISTRITLTSILGIVIPVLILAGISGMFFHTVLSRFNYSTVTTNSYSMLNQIQWNQTMASISNELISSDSDEVKRSSVSGFVSPLEELGVKLYIEKNDKEFYATAKKADVLKTANGIMEITDDKNVNYFGENGMVIVNHASDGSSRYLVIAASNDYTVKDISARYRAEDFPSMLFSRTGVMAVFIALVFVLSIIVLSLITSKTISKPIRELADGANEIANGNLDYEIDYDSTNEIGVTVKSFNHMTAQLKSSLEKQSALEQSRKEMIAGVAHDLRTPLTSVKGYVEGLRDGIANTPEKQENYLKTIYSSTLTMERLLDDLLTISRLELGSITLSPAVTDLTGFLNDCADELSFELEKQNFDFEYNNNCSDGVLVNLDVDRFSRVITNIVSNSVKYAKKDVKGKIVLEAQEYSKSVIISISDNGIGLDSESLPKIFETFYRADKARSKTSEGSGIGLAVCKQIVELHGGNIWATGEEGKGLTVHISLNKIQGENDGKKDTDC
ncbi:MAG: HAMP domain-containing histidine kinase [Eubacterium sp.]|nr:HAMP domain-containing histidine kinase [Eubacterium sp.]